jgi:hypothetical protein
VAGLTLFRPIVANITAPGSGVANLQTPSPREIWIAPGTGAQTIDLDLQSAQDVDCFYLGSTNARADAVWTIQSIAAIGGAVTATHVNAQAMRLAGNIRTRYPAFARLPAPVTGRYFRIVVNQPTTPMQIGVLAAGLAVEWPYAYGSGRLPIDTSRVVAHPDGGFGVDPGIVKTAFQWRFVDLDETMLDKLWAIADERGESKPIVAVEGPSAPPKATAVHYGLFRKFEAFEREDAAQTKWAFSIEEWR